MMDERATGFDGEVYTFFLPFDHYNLCIYGCVERNAISGE
jgi:hypothetical protein